MANGRAGANIESADSSMTRMRRSRDLLKIVVKMDKYYLYNENRTSRDRETRLYRQHEICYLSGGLF